MNIALFSDCYSPIKNGVVTSMVQLKEGLEKKGHSVFVVSVKVPDHKDLSDSIFRVSSVPFGKGTEQRVGLVNQWRVQRFLRKHNVGLVHTHSEFFLGLSGRLAAKRLKIPHVHTTHTMWKDYSFYILKAKKFSNIIIYKYLKEFMEAVTAVVSPSIKAKKYFASISQKPPYRIIHNGVDFKNFMSEEVAPKDLDKVRADYNLKESDRVLIFTGRLGQEKRVLDLLELVKPVLRKHENLKIIFVGDGPQKIQLKDLANSYDLTDKVILTGFIDWKLIYEFYLIADLYVTASMSEVHPMTLIEAAMTGLPALARRDDAYTSLIKEGENGYLCDTDEDLGTAIDKLINDSHKLKKFSETTKKLSQDFTAQHHVDKMERLYKEIIATYPDKISKED